MMMNNAGNDIDCMLHWVKIRRAAISGSHLLLVVASCLCMQLLSVLNIENSIILLLPLNNGNKYSWKVFLQRYCT